MGAMKFPQNCWKDNRFERTSSSSKGVKQLGWLQHRGREACLARGFPHLHLNTAATNLCDAYEIAGRQPAGSGGVCPSHRERENSWYAIH